MKKKFNFRAFVSLYIVLSFLVMTISGIILYLAPPGRIANWSNWKLLGLLKAQWQAVHTIFTFIFVAAIIFHIYFNWKPLVAYLKTKLNSFIIPRKEILASSVLATLVFIFTIKSTVPFSSVMNFGEELKNSWSAQNTEPPIPHAEEQSLTKFAETIKANPTELMSKLSAKGIKIESDSLTIKEISKNNNISLSQLYKLAEAAPEHQPNSSGQGRGYGRKSVEQVCNELNISVNDGIRILKVNGIIAEKDEKLKDVATRYNVSPADIANTISGSM